LQCLIVTHIFSLKKYRASTFRSGTTYQLEHGDGGRDSGEEADRQGFGEVFLFERGTRETAFFFLFFHDFDPLILVDKTGGFTRRGAW